MATTDGCKCRIDGDTIVFCSVHRAAYRMHSSVKDLVHAVELLNSVGEYKKVSMVDAARAIGSAHDKAAKLLKEVGMGMHTEEDE